jgi:hypothetical protein
MFNKKQCKKCGKKINEKYDYCPSCGNPLDGNTKQRNNGMLGTNDFIPSNEIKLPMGVNVIFNSLMKNLNKQFEEIEKDDRKIRQPKNLKQGISISISSSGNKPPQIRVNQIGKNPNVKPVKKPAKLLPSFSRESMGKFSNFSKEEPMANIRRLSDRVIYEIDLPDVKSIKDVSVVKLENSIEIKAIAKDKAYSKVISINLPIIDYNFSDEKLVLELGIKN